MALLLSLNQFQFLSNFTFSLKIPFLKLHPSLFSLILLSHSQTPVSSFRTLNLEEKIDSFQFLNK